MSGTYAYYSGDVPGLAGKYHYGDGGRGILGSLIPSSGDNGPSYLFASLNLPADGNKEYYGVIGTLPAGLTISADENGAIISSANDGIYTVPFDLYESAPGAATVKLGSTNFVLNFGVVTQTINLVGTNSTENSTSSTGAATVTPAAVGPKTVNVTAANASLSMQSSAGVVIVTSANQQPTNITVPLSRTAVFKVTPRTIVYSSGANTSVLNKSPLDQFYYMANVSKELNDIASTILSVVVAAINGVTLLEGPVPQGNLLVAKFGGGDPTIDNFCTLRVTTASGEQFDHTLKFIIVEDLTWTFDKDPDDRRYYAWDFSADATLSSSPVATVGAPTAKGVTVVGNPVFVGNKVYAKISGLDVTDGAINSCAMPAILASGEVVVRKISFNKVDN